MIWSFDIPFVSENYMVSFAWWYYSFEKIGVLRRTRTTFDLDVTEMYHM
jgi:hypothetical protein